MTSTRVPEAEIAGLYGAMIKRMSRRILGEVPDSLGVLWHHRAVLKDAMVFSRKAERWDRLDPNLSTFAAMGRPARSAAVLVLTSTTS